MDYNQIVSPDQFCILSNNLIRDYLISLFVTIIADDELLNNPYER